MHIGILKLTAIYGTALFEQHFCSAGDTRGIDETADPESMPAHRQSGAIFPIIVLVGSLVIFAAAGMFAWALQSRHQKYEPLSQSDLTEEISSRHRSQRFSTDA